MRYNKQRNITISEEKIQEIKKLFGTVKNTELAKKLGIGYGCLTQNLKLLGYTKERGGKVIQMEGYFSDSLVHPITGLLPDVRKDALMKY